MSTQIVDNFQLNVAKPIDSRMVTYGAASRDNLQFKYEGLRVYDVSDQKPYVYIGGAWKAESGSGSGSGSVSLGTNQRLVKYTSNSTIGDSAIWDKGTYAAPSIGIGMDPISGYALTVKGSIKIDLGTGGFDGNGSAIFDINGNNIIANSIPVTKLLPSTTNNQILVTDSNGAVKWVDNINSGVVITNRAPVSTSTVAPGNATHYLLFTDVTNSPTGNSIYANNYGSGNKLIGVKPSTSQILASGDTTNNQSLPSYTFSGNTTSGLYGLSDEIGLSYGGKGLVKLNSSQLSILNVGQATVLSSRSNGVLFGTDVHSYPDRFRFNPETQEMEVVPTPRKEYPLIISKDTSSAAEPSYTWNGDTGTGMYRPANNEVALTTNGEERFKVTNSMTTIRNAATMSSTLNVTGLSTLSSLTVNSVFKLTSGSPGPGKTLMSDSAGNGTWQDTLVGVPYGTIIMWVNAECVPTGWKVCLTDTYGYIFIKDRYYSIPDMRDYSISGNSTMTGGYQRFGTKSPKTQYSFSVGWVNLPPHTHGAGTLVTDTEPAHRHKIYAHDNISSGDRIAQADTADGSNEVANDSNGEAGAHSHAITGDTGSGPGNSTPITLPLNKSIGMIFIIKYNPNAAENTEGFVNYETKAKTYNEANGFAFTGLADSTSAVYIPPAPGGGPAVN